MWSGVGYSRVSLSIQRHNPEQSLTQWKTSKQNKTQTLKILDPCFPSPCLLRSLEGSGKVSSKVVHFQFTDIKISYTKAKQKKNVER